MVCYGQRRGVHGQSRIESRFQRLFVGNRIPGAMPQARSDTAPLALNEEPTATVAYRLSGICDE
jgi:hypothetical protein